MHYEMLTLIACREHIPSHGYRHVDRPYMLWPVASTMPDTREAIKLLTGRSCRDGESSGYNATSEEREVCVFVGVRVCGGGCSTTILWRVLDTEWETAR